jgi:hypothetical protein
MSVIWQSLLIKEVKRFTLKVELMLHGRIYNAVNGNVKIYGRGVLSGRDFKWSVRLDQNGGILGVDSYTANNAHIGFSSGAGSNTIEGIVVCDGAGHGVNLGISNNVYRNFKTWAWHPNNDGMRPWGRQQYHRKLFCTCM